MENTDLIQEIIHALVLVVGGTILIFLGFSVIAGSANDFGFFIGIIITFIGVLMFYFSKDSVTQLLMIGSE